MCCTLAAGVQGLCKRLFSEHQVLQSQAHTAVDAMARFALMAAALVHAHKHCVDDYDELKARGLLLWSAVFSGGRQVQGDLERPDLGPLGT